MTATFRAAAHAWVEALPPLQSLAVCPQEHLSHMRPVTVSVMASSVLSWRSSLHEPPCTLQEGCLPGRMLQSREQPVQLRRDVLLDRGDSIEQGDDVRPFALQDAPCLFRIPWRGGD